MGIATATEKRFLATVTQYARLHGWTVHHQLVSPGSAPGFPDLVFVRGDAYTCRVVVAELKTETGRATPEQLACLEAFSTVCPTFLWTPVNWPEIERVLGAEA